MPFMILSWNVQRLSNRTARQNRVVQLKNRPGLISQAIDVYNPDVVHLAEVSHDFNLPGYTEVAQGHTLDRRQGETQLNTKVFLRNGSPVVIDSARTLRVGKGQPRLGIKVQITDGPNSRTVYMVHSKASNRPAREALEDMNRLVAADASSVALGDMNADLRRPSNRRAATQRYVQLVSPLSATGQPRATHRRGGTLDYAIASPNLTVRAIGKRNYQGVLQRRDRTQIRNPSTGLQLYLRARASTIEQVSDHDEQAMIIC